MRLIKLTEYNPTWSRPIGKKGRKYPELTLLSSFNLFTGVELLSQQVPLIFFRHVLIEFDCENFQLNCEAYNLV